MIVDVLSCCREFRQQQIMEAGERQRLVRKVENGKVKFDYDLKPKKFGLLSMVWPPYFFRQRRATNSMQKVPVDHAAWIGSQLAVICRLGKSHWTAAHGP